MGRAVAREAFKLHRQVDEPLHLVVVVVFGLEIGRAVERARQRPRVGRVVGHHLAQPVDVAVAHLQDAPRIAQHRARLELAEGDDLRDVVVPVFLLDVTDHLAAAGFAEVDIEVGHRHAFGIEEAFEQQAQLDRIEIGDRQRPGDEATRARTTARPHGDVVVLGPFDEVGNDQEVAGEAHLVDDVDFELQPVEIDLALLVAHLAIRFEPGFQSLARIFFQRARLALEVAREAGQDRLAVGRRIGTALRHDERVLDRFGQVVEGLFHHVVGLDVTFGVRLGALLRIDMRRAGNAQHRIMRLVHVRLREIGRISGDQRKVARIGEVDQRCLGTFLDRVPAPRKFDVEPFGEQRLQPVERGFGMALLAFRQKPRDRALACPGECDQPVGISGEIVHPDMRIIFERAFEMRLRNEVAKIVVTRLVLRIEREVIDLLALAVARDTEQRTDDRLHAFRLAGIGEHDGAVKPVAVGDRDRGKTALLGQLSHRLRIDRALEHRIGGKDTKGDEGLVWHAAQYAQRAGIRQAVRSPLSSIPSAGRGQGP